MVRVPGCQKLQVTDFNPVWHRMLYCCSHMATVGVEGLIATLCYSTHLIHLYSL